MITLFIIFLIVRHKKYCSFIKENSLAIKKLISINKKYFFNNINSNLNKYYDDINNYKNISPYEYLVWHINNNKNYYNQLINQVKQNSILYNSYISEIKNYCKLYQYDIPVKLRNIKKLKRLEKKFLYEIKQNPTVELKIIVHIYFTNAFSFINKYDVFNTNDIKKFIYNLEDNNNGYYSNKIWQILSKVERGEVSKKLRLQVYNRDGYRCKKCGSNNNLEIDHIIPISKGGKSNFENLQTLCHSCNYKKSNIVENVLDNDLLKNKFDKICPIWVLH